jgi:hypothetical protein
VHYSKEARPDELKGWMNRGRDFRDEGARENFFRDRFGERVVAWLKQVLLPAYVHRNGDDNPALENFPFTFSKLPPAKIEDDELVGEAFDDPSKTGAVLFVVLMSWWEFSIHRRQLDFLKDPEAMLYQATLVSLVRCFRAVTVWRRGCRHNMEMVTEPSVKKKVASKGVRRSKDDDTYGEPEGDEDEDEDELNSSQYRESSVARPNGRPSKAPRAHVLSRLGMTSTTSSAGSTGGPPSRSPTESSSHSTEEEDPETSTAALLGGRHITLSQPPSHRRGAAATRRPGSNPPRATQPELSGQPSRRPGSNPPRVSQPELSGQPSRPRPRPIFTGKGSTKAPDLLFLPGTPHPPSSPSRAASEGNPDTIEPASKRRTRSQVDEGPSEEQAEATAPVASRRTSLRLQKDVSSAGETSDLAPRASQRAGHIKTRGTLAVPTLRTSELFGPPKARHKRQKTDAAEDSDALAGS